MPVYLYKCKICEEIKEISHSVGAVMTDCDKCGSQNVLEKIFNIPTVIKSNSIVNKSGQNIKKFIEEAKQDLEEQKKEIKRGDIKK